MTAHTTDTPLKCNDNHSNLKSFDPRISLPLPPEGSVEMDVYARFMRHLRHVPNSRMDIKILSSLQFTADMTDLGDAFVSKLLVECGLRAPRAAFPASYLEYVDRSLMRSGWDIGGPCSATLALKSHWDRIGEDRFAAFRREYPRVQEPITL
jgi:hypothetical protein